MDAGKEHRYEPLDPTVRAWRALGGMWAVEYPGTPPLVAYMDDVAFARNFRLSVSTEAEQPDFVVVVPTTPTRAVSPNANNGFNRYAGMAYKREKKRLRAAAKKEVKNAREKYPPGTSPTYGMESVIRVTVAWERKPTKRSPKGLYRRDVDAHDALPLMCKGMIDGLVDGGLLEEDRYLTVSYSQERDPAGVGYTMFEIWGRRVPSLEAKPEPEPKTKEKQ